MLLPDVGNLLPQVILNEDNFLLSSIPSEEEIKQAIFSIPMESSSGPDGFGSGFYRAC